MSLDVYLIETVETDVFSANITHNLRVMADEAGIYKHLWRPEEIGIVEAHQLIKPLKEGIEKMEADPDRFRKFDSPNGWGTYDAFLPWLEDYLEACIENPSAYIRVSR